MRYWSGHGTMHEQWQQNKDFFPLCPTLQHSCSVSQSANIFMGSRSFGCLWQRLWKGPIFLCRPLLLCSTFALRNAKSEGSGGMPSAKGNFPLDICARTNSPPCWEQFILFWVLVSRFDRRVHIQINISTVCGAAKTEKTFFTSTRGVQESFFLWLNWIPRAIWEE